MKNESKSKTLSVYIAHTRGNVYISPWAQPEGLCNITECAAINPALAGSYIVACIRFLTGSIRLCTYSTGIPPTLPHRRAHKTILTIQEFLIHFPHRKSHTPQPRISADFS